MTQVTTSKFHRRMNATSLWHLVVQLLLGSFCRANFLSEPILRWSIQLDGSTRKIGRGLRQGNAVVAHPNGSELIVTADDGSLHILQTTTSTATSLAVFEPEALEGRFTKCLSGAAIVQPDDDGNEFIVYTVVDTPSMSNVTVDNSDDGVSSRVLAVGMDGTLKWSVSLPGKIVGNPALGDTKRIMYIAHNVNSVGSLSVLQMNNSIGNATIVATLVSSATEGSNGNGPFGPPIVRPSDSTSTSGGDIVLVAESWGGGFSEDRGGLFMLSPSAEFEAASGVGNDSYQLQRISSWPFSAITTPLIIDDSIYLGAAGGNLAFWTGDQRNDLWSVVSGGSSINPSWVFQVVPNTQNASQPLLSAPVLDSLGDVLILAGVNSDLYAIDTSRGRDIWAESGGSQIIARPQLWESDDLNVVYVIESQDGGIQQYELYSGSRLWGFSCADITGDDFCQDAVEAEFAIAPSGNVLYYGDIFGSIVSLEIATFATEAPSSSPTSLASSSPSEQPQATSSPTASPTVAPSIYPNNPASVEPAIPRPSTPTLASAASPTPSDGSDTEAPTMVGQQSNSLNSQEQQQREQSGGSLAVYIGAGVGALCAFLLAFLLFSLRRKRNTKKRDESALEIIDDCEPEDLGSYDLEEATETSSLDGGGIEVEFVGSRAVPRTPQLTSHSKKKNKKKKKQSPQTPQTVQTLESIEELADEAPASGNAHMPKSRLQFMKQEDDDFINPINLSDKFALVGETQILEEYSENELDPSVADESGRVTPVARGGVGRPQGSNHLELSVGNNNLSPLTSGEPLDEKSSFGRQGGNFVSRASSDNNEGDSSDDDAPPPPPPAPIPGAPWSFYSLLQMSSSQLSKKKDLTMPGPGQNHSESLRRADSVSPATPPPTNLEDSKPPTFKHENAVMKPTKSLNNIDSSTPNPEPEKIVRPNGSKNEYSVDLPRTSPQNLVNFGVVIDHVPVSSPKNEAVTSCASASIEQAHSGNDYGTDPSLLEIPRSTPSRNSNDSEEPASLSHQDLDPPLQQQVCSEGNIEEEKKEGEESDVTSQSPDILRYTPFSPSLLSKHSGLSPTSPSSSTGPLGLSRASSPGAESARSVASSRISTQSNSNASTDDDSLYTSATGNTGEPKIDTSNLSPLSTYIFDKAFERDVIPMDEARVALMQPNLGKARIGGGSANSTPTVPYLQDNDAPDDEMVLPPGSQYISKNQEAANEKKYGRSVRSKREPSTFQQGTRNDGTANFGSYDSDNESPLAAIYSQLAAMGQQKAEEKRPSYRRRSKREELHDSPAQEQESDTWGSFLQELKEAEKQFFAPTSTHEATMLQLGDSHDSEDSEVARINNTL